MNIFQILRKIPRPVLSCVLSYPLLNHHLNLVGRSPFQGPSLRWSAWFCPAIETSRKFISDRVGDWVSQTFVLITNTLMFIIAILKLLRVPCWDFGCFTSVGWTCYSVWHFTLMLCCWISSAITESIKSESIRSPTFPFVIWNEEVEDAVKLSSCVSPGPEPGLEMRGSCMTSLVKSE